MLKALYAPPVDGFIRVQSSDLGLFWLETGRQRKRAPAAINSN